MGWRIGSIGGAPLYLAKSWPIGAVLLGVIYFASFGTLLPTGQAVAVSAVAVVVLFLSVLAHEISHGVTGRLLRRPPESYTLTLLGGHTTFRGPDPSPRTMALISLAGPCANLALAALAWAGSGLTSIGVYLLPVAIVNLVLGLFNLAPGLPMDGGFIVAALGWYATGDREKGMEISGWTGRVIAILIGIVALALAVTVRSTGAIWMALIAAFLWTGASRSIQIARARRSVSHVDLRPLMMPTAAIEFSSVLRDVPPSGAVLVNQGWPVAYIPIGNLGAELDPQTPATAVSLAVPTRNVVSTPTGPDAVAAVAGADGDLVVLIDRGYYWVGSVKQIAAHVAR